MISPLFVVFIPLAAGILALFLKNKFSMNAITVITPFLHLLATAALFSSGATGKGSDLIQVDALSLIILLSISMLFLPVSIYAISYMDKESDGKFDITTRKVFVCCLMVFVASMSLSTITKNMGLIWIAIETTTIASAPLIAINKTQRSLEAVWKYLILCSVGIALALLGNLFLAVAENGKSTAETVQWLKAAFILLMVGYGTKAGLAPMHTWLPDAYSEAPSPVFPLLSTALLNCALLGIVRVAEIANRALLVNFTSDILILFGLVSLGFAAAFLLFQQDYKRLLAYSSIENVGIITFGFGISFAGSEGALLHILSHSVIKGALFLTAGNILLIYRTKAIHAATGLIATNKPTGLLFFFGFLAITGFPPFGTFFSELKIISASFSTGHELEGTIFVIALVVSFIGLSKAFIRMSLGKPQITTTQQNKCLIPISMILPQIILLLVAILLGLFLPDKLESLFREGAAILTGSFDGKIIP